MATDYEALYADITDVNVLKQKRRSRHRMITHQEPYVSTQSKVTLENIHHQELVSKLNKLNKDLVSDHEALQNRIEDLSAHVDDETEFAADSS